MAVTTTTGGGGGGTTTTFPTPSLFAVNVFAFCGDDNLPLISITFGNRPDLNGQVGVLSFSTGGSVFLVFQSNQTVTIPYPNTTQNVNLIYSLGPETATASVTYPEDCLPGTTTTGAPTSTSTTVAATTTTTGATTTTSTTSSTTTTSSTAPTSSTSTTLPLQLNGAATVCRAEVPTIVITFGNTFPELAGQTGTLTMSDVNGNVVSTQPLVYAPGTTVELLYPGTVVNPDGSIDDVPGWILTDDGLWIRDPSDEYLREGILLTYTLNPTATAFVTYPPESSACANPENPLVPGEPVPGKPGQTVPPRLPATGGDTHTELSVAIAAVGGGAALVLAARRRRRV